MRQVLADVTPRTIILTPDGRVGFYAWRYRADDGRAMGRVLVQERRGDRYALTGGAVWLDVDGLALRVERGADGVKIGAFGRDETDTGRLPLRALHFLPGEV